MSNWSNGYVTDIGYTYGYYPELSPLQLRLAFIAASLTPPKVTRACELGFGQGISINIHASSTNISWSGNDFNPSQARFAQELSDLSGNGAKLYDQSFLEFANRTDLPDFDYIGMHGIWSWISNENRSVIVDFIKRKLKVGGVLYVSYNSQPGWSQIIPLRNLLNDYTKVMTPVGLGNAGQIDAALEFAEKLMNTNPLFNQVNKSVVDSFNKLKSEDPHYLAHEYFNQDWLPTTFSEVANWLVSAKLSYVCSANYFDHINSINLTPEMQTLLASIPDVTYRESVRDFMVNQKFRKDYWVKGTKPLNPLERIELLRDHRIILIRPRNKISLMLNAPVGELHLHESVYDPLLDLLADYQPKSLGELEYALRDNQINLPQILESVLVLYGAGILAGAQDNEAISRSKVSTEKINKTLLDMCRGTRGLGFLASPVIGGGVPVGAIFLC